MAKGINQKQKLIRLLMILQEKTDINHRISTGELIDELDKYGISAERKSIYSDIETLCDLGFDIEFDKTKNGGYYLASRPIEKHEMVLLVDAISSSMFITHKKSRELIKKLESLLSKYDAIELDREVYVNNRIKQDNESIYYTVDDIHNAISKGFSLTFNYCEWTADKVLVPRHNGKIYRVSPLSLIWEDEKYYLVAVDESCNEIRHYRVDKIKNINITEDKVKLNDFRNFDIASYGRKFFGMFGGDTGFVELKFNPNQIGVLIDRFGKDISVRKLNDDECVARVEVSVSPQFFGWIAGLNGDIRINGPAEITQKYKDYLKKEIANY